MKSRRVDTRRAQEWIHEVHGSGYIHEEYRRGYTSEEHIFYYWIEAELHIYAILISQYCTDVAQRTRVVWFVLVKSTLTRTRVHLSTV